LRAYQWPGNVRELPNVLERATVICSGATIEADDLSLDPPSVCPRSKSTSLILIERSTIERAMRETDGNISKAARTLGISRTQLYGRLRKHGLSQAPISN
jgi:transcriptional regulator of acetoin/glycerol metabolism